MEVLYPKKRGGQPEFELPASQSLWQSAYLHLPLQPFLPFAFAALGAAFFAGFLAMAHTPY